MRIGDGKDSQSPRCGRDRRHRRAARPELELAVGLAPHHLRDDLTSSERPEGDAARHRSARERRSFLGLLALFEVPALAQEQHHRRVWIGEINLREAHTPIGLYARAERHEAHVVERRHGRFVLTEHESHGELGLLVARTRARFELAKEPGDLARAVERAAVLIRLERTLEILDGAERPHEAVLVELRPHHREARLKIGRRVRHPRMKEHRREIERGVERPRVVLLRAAAERDDHRRTLVRHRLAERPHTR
jgi:hypothetical protein